MAQPAKPARSRDGCAVETSRLAPLLAAFVEAWQRERPATAGRFTVTVANVTAYEWLEAETGLSQDTIEKIVRWRPDRQTTSPVVELRVADVIVSAIGRPEVFRDGTPPTLPVIVNPRANADERLACARELASCCGGSTF